jgi:Cytochrome C oxidase subunit II, transmembrane domain
MIFIKLDLIKKVNFIRSKGFTFFSVKGIKNDYNNLFCINIISIINKKIYSFLFNKKSTHNIRADVPLAWGLYFQDGASPSFEGIVDLHNRIMFYLVVVLFGVSWVMLSIL